MPRKPRPVDDGQRPSQMPDLMPVPAPSLAAIAERDRRAAEEIRAHANLYRIPLADLLASLALDGWQWRRSQADGNV